MIQGEIDPKTPISVCIYLYIRIQGESKKIQDQQCFAQNFPNFQLLLCLGIKTLKWEKKITLVDALEKELT